MSVIELVAVVEMATFGIVLLIALKQSEQDDE